MNAKLQVEHLMLYHLHTLSHLSALLSALLRPSTLTSAPFHPPLYIFHVRTFACSYSQDLLAGPRTMHAYTTFSAPTPLQGACSLWKGAGVRVARCHVPRDGLPAAKTAAIGAYI